MEDLLNITTFNPPLFSLVNTFKRDYFFKENPLVKRVVSVFDADNSGEVDFKVVFKQIRQSLKVILKG